MVRRITIVVLLLFGLVMGPTQRARSQDSPSFEEVLVAVLGKVLSFDNSLQERVGDEIVIGILYQGRYRPSLNSQKSLVVAAKGRSRKTIQKLPVRFESIDLERNELGASIEDLSVNVLYVTQLRAFPIESISKVSRARDVVTCTSVAEYVDLGLAVGIDLTSGRPKLVINLDAARQEGADFSAKLLNLARIVETPGHD